MFYSQRTSASLRIIDSRKRHFESLLFHKCIYHCIGWMNPAIGIENVFWDISVKNEECKIFFSFSRVWICDCCRNYKLPGNCKSFQQHTARFRFVEKLGNCKSFLVGIISNFVLNMKRMYVRNRKTVITVMFWIMTIHRCSVYV